MTVVMVCSSVVVMVSAGAVWERNTVWVAVAVTLSVVVGWL
jgi:hypothetical protein